MIGAKVICDSVSKQGKRLTTFRLRYPKFIHGEAKTHRVISCGNEGGYYVTEQEVGLMDDKLISRNASSSRAVPTAKLIEEVRSDALRAGPVFWGANQKGMQAVEELSDVLDDMDVAMMDFKTWEEVSTGWGNSDWEATSPLRRAQHQWKMAALSAANHASDMLKNGVHKQIVNRLLEPFSHINVVASATEWDNFFGLRLDRAAQPEMRELAVAMWDARKASTPRLLRPGEWHLPFVEPDQGAEWREAMLSHRYVGDGNNECWDEDGAMKQLIKVSVARCARVSYESFETGRRSTVEEDLKLYDRLLGAQPLHASPAEHQATPDEWAEYELDHAPTKGVSRFYHDWAHQTQWGNLRGWRQYRKFLEGEAVAPLPEEFR